MLDQIRRGAANILAKILLGLLIIAFAVWGVADVFRGYGRGTLAKIGDTEITVDDDGFILDYPGLAERL